MENIYADVMLGCRGLCWAYAVHFTAHVSSPLGDDMINLLFHFLDEFLFLMCDDPYFIVKVLQKKKEVIYQENFPL